MLSKKMMAEVSRPSAIRAMFEKGAELKKTYGADNVFDFSLGNPNVPPPDRVNAEIIRLVEENRENLHGYMPNAGYPYVREAVARKLNAMSKTRFTPDGVVLTSGAAAGLNVVFKSIIDPGDEVILIAPYFVEYKAYAGNFGAVPVPVMAREDTFLPDTEAIGAALTDRTKAIILNTPNNPTGAVYDRDTLEDLAEVLENFSKKTGREIFVVSDEPYREIVFGATVPVIADIFRNSITVYSFSKSLSLSGERIGYIAVPPSLPCYSELMDALILSNRILGFVNAPALFQLVIAECLDCEVDIAIYRQKRDALYDIITSAGFSCHKPEGAFYLFPRSPIADDTVFCNDYALKYNILAAPGTAFGAPGYFRLVYCVGDGTIERSRAAFKGLAGEVL